AWQPAGLGRVVSGWRPRFGLYRLAVLERVAITARGCRGGRGPDLQHADDCGELSAAVLLEQYADAAGDEQHSDGRGAGRHDAAGDHERGGYGHNGVGRDDRVDDERSERYAGRLRPDDSVRQREHAECQPGDV